MKKIIGLLMGLLLLASTSQAMYITSNTANTNWASSTVAATSSLTSGYVNTTGCQYALFTAGNSMTASDFTIEAHWYIAGTATLVSSETMTNAVALQVKSPRAKFQVYNNDASLRTIEAVVYCY